MTRALRAVPWPLVACLPILTRIALEWRMTRDAWRLR
jgi:hypothetical protein